MIEVKIEKIALDIDTPSYAHEGDAGFDLRSREEVIIEPGHRYTCMTGIKIAIPPGYHGSIRDRSGLAHKQGLHVLAGVVDSNYRGEVGVVLQNLGTEDVVIEKNMRIAQMLIEKVETARIQVVATLEETIRGASGFGSSGNK